MPATGLLVQPTPARRNVAKTRRCLGAVIYPGAASADGRARKRRLPVNLTRCPWSLASPEYVHYHDQEWGVPVHDDRILFEYLTLEGAQAGLSWSTILAKRDNYYRAFGGFDPKRVAKFGARDITRLMNDAGIVRNRLKIESTINNARAFLAVQRQYGSFDAYIWGFVGGATHVNRHRSTRSVPPKTAVSDALSKDLRQRGFRFVGSTICYAFMQAVGLVNDHLLQCFRHRALAGGADGRRKVRPKATSRDASAPKRTRRKTGRL